MPDTTGGWFEPGPPITPEQARARHEQTERAVAADDRRRREAVRAEFGDPSDPQVTSVALPLSGLTVQWRADGYWRVVDPEEADDSADEDDWQPWDPDDGTTGIAEGQPGDSATPTWWVEYGPARPAAEVALRLADGTDVPVLRVGHLWVAEWRALAQPVFVRVDGVVTPLTPLRAEYAGPAVHPFTRTAPDPYA